MADQTILLIEDDGDIRETILEALHDEDYSAVGASDGVEAIEYLSTAGTLPRLILLDLTMPKMNGAEFRARIAKVSEWAAIPTVVFTADVQAEIKANDLGAVAFLRKPIKLNELFSTVERFLQRTTTP